MNPRGILLSSLLMLAWVAPQGARADVRAAEDAAAEDSWSLPRWEGEVSPALAALARVLRASRRADGRVSWEGVDLAGEGASGTADAALEILVRRRIPETSPDDSAQVLSAPQRALLLGLVARLPEALVRAHLGKRVGPALTTVTQAPPDAALALAAIHVLGAVGKEPDLARIARLAPRNPPGQAGLTRDARDAVREACAGILRRDPRAWTALPRHVRSFDDALARPVLSAVGAEREPRALDTLFEAVRAHPALKPQAVALVVKTGRSLDAELDEQFVLWMRAELSAARPEYARTLLQAIGVLDEGDAVPDLIEQLSAADAGVRDSAVWALRRLSGHGFPAEPGAWQVWYDAEQLWHSVERPRLRELLLSPDDVRVTEALRAYSQQRTHRADLAADVAELLGSHRAVLRGLACGVLQDLGATTSLPALTAALDDPEDHVAQAAWQALRSITGLDLSRDPEQARAVLGRS